MAIDSTSMRALWPGTNGTIPAGWSRDTAFDNRFLQGDDSGYTAPADAGGGHSHTANAHTHTGDIHRHSFTGGTSATITTVSVRFNFFGALRVALSSHAHSTADGAFRAINYQDATVTIDTDNTPPPSVRVIVIKPDDASQDIPDDACCFTDETGGSIPTGFEKCDAGGTRLDWNGKFIRGATTGSDGDDTGEGSATHANNVQDHDHQDNGHTHAEIGAGTTIGQKIYDTPNDVDARRLAHHDRSMDGSTLSDVSNASLTLDTASTEPAYVKLLGIQNTSDAATTPIGVVCAFVGSFAAIPSNWELLSAAENKQIKSTATDGEVGDTGGSNTHTHTFASSGSHGHTHAAGHIHTSTSGTELTGNFVESGPVSVVMDAPTDKHTHVWTIDSTTPTIQNTNVTLSGTDDGRQEYRTVLLVKKTSLALPSNAVLLGTNF